jgi:hypothetical protein
MPARKNKLAGALTRRARDHKKAIGRREFTNVTLHTKLPVRTGQLFIARYRPETEL